MNEQNICRRKDSPCAYRLHEPAGAAAAADTDSGPKDRNELAYNSGGYKRQINALVALELPTASLHHLQMAVLFLFPYCPALWARLWF